MSQILEAKRKRTSTKELILSDPSPGEPPQPYVNVRVTDYEGRTQMRNIPVKVVLDLVMSGGGDHPGVVLDDSENFLTPFEREVIEYGANEGTPDDEGGTDGVPRTLEGDWEDEDAEPGEWEGPDYEWYPGFGVNCRRVVYAYKQTKKALEYANECMDMPREQWPSWVIGSHTEL